MVHELTVDTFEQMIAEGVSVVDFYADRCGPCRILAPLLPRLAEKFGDQVMVGKVNVDQQSPLAQKMGITSMPTVLILVNGQEVERMRGLREPQEYVQAIQFHLDG